MENNQQNNQSSYSDPAEQQPSVSEQPQDVSTENESESSNEITGIDSHNLLAALSYLGILVLVPLFMAKKDPFIVFHAKQGLVILAGYIVASILAVWMPFLGNILWLFLIVISIIGFIQTMRSRRWKIPGIGDIAEKFTI